MKLRLGKLKLTPLVFIHNFCYAGARVRVQTSLRQAEGLCPN